VLEASFTKSLGDFTLKSSFKVEKGVMAILGSSGCGKSMTLKCIAGLFKPDGGEIHLNGRTLFSSDKRVNVLPRNRNIGYVFQNSALFPHMTVRKNIAYAAKGLRSQNISEIIEKMQLSGLENHYPYQLSGGQQQRAALARTLIREPELLMLDEPFSALDNHLKHLLELELLSIIRSNYNGIVLLVTHNIEEAYRLSDNIMVMDKGLNLQVSPKNELISKPANVAAARITGCKNFVDVEITGETENYHILRSGSLCMQAVKTGAAPDRRMIAGIRAHHIILFPPEDIRENVYNGTVLEKIEGVFSVTLILDCCGKTLRAEADKSHMPRLASCDGSTIKVHIPPQYIFLMEG
jgi:molybdate transport system ATP-binding protein